MNKTGPGATALRSRQGCCQARLLLRSCRRRAGRLVPRAAAGVFVPPRGLARVFGGVAREVAAPTRARGGGVSETTPFYLDCWGAKSWCVRPLPIQRHACGRGWTCGSLWVRSAWRALLDAQARKLGREGSPVDRGRAARLDRGARDEPNPPLKPCCRGEDGLAAACPARGSCVARDPRPAGREGRALAAPERRAPPLSARPPWTADGRAKKTAAWSSMMKWTS